FTCCHPALSRPAQIAHAFLVKESTVAQRIVRARRKIVAAHIPYRMPSDGDMSDRLSEVLAVLYLMFTEGYLASSGTLPTRRDLAEDAAGLATWVSQHMPGEPEPLALLRLHLARSKARFTSAGELILLQDQDRTLWDQPMIAEGIALIEQAAALRRPGPYQV